MQKTNKVETNSLCNNLRDGLDQLGIGLTNEAQEKMLHYVALLQKWNKVYNLTAINNPEQMIPHHLLDCIAILPYLWPQRWLDVGSGAGLPGIILAIAKPEWSFTLLDSNSKKTSFIQQTCIELGLANVDVQCERVELWRTNKLFDGIISRAFAETAEFILTTRHLLKQNGRWVAMKGRPEQELQYLPENVSVEKKVLLNVPELGASRCLVILRENS